jgi:hypothetical protein
MALPIEYLNARRESKPASGGTDHTIWRKSSDYLLPTRLRCTGCGEEVDAGCDCGAAYAPVVERLAVKSEQDRQRARAYRERKAQEKQRPRHVTRTIKLINKVLAITDQMTRQERELLLVQLARRYA